MGIPTLAMDTDDADDVTARSQLVVPVEILGAFFAKSPKLAVRVRDLYSR